LRIPRIYTDSDLDTQHSVDLEAKAHKHLKDALRMKPGDSVILFNGNGNDYQGTIKEISKKVLRIDIKEAKSINNESKLELHLLQPLCSSEKLDLCIQKATELGVKTIIPFVSSRVNINIASNRLEKKMSHWQSVIQSACEQSGRARLPAMHTPVSFSDAVCKIADAEIKIIASPYADKQENLTIKETVNCVCAIGPEGGFTQQEINHAIQLGFKTIRIGPRILRLETAVISALTLCQFSWGDFSRQA